MSRVMSRRRWLHLAGGTLASLGIAGRLYAAPPGGPRFLLVFLRGGYDATNTLIPYSSDFYYEARPTIAIPKPDHCADTGALATDSDWALAPALRESIGALYQQREVAFVPFTGTPDLSRSHFETQDSIELGQPREAPRDYRPASLARLHRTLAPAGTAAGAAIAFTDALPIALQGPDHIPNISLRNVGKPSFDERQMRIISGMYAGHPLEPAVAGGLEPRAGAAQALTTASE